MIHKIPVMGEWVIISDEFIATLPTGTQEFYHRRIHEMTFNPISCFLAHGLSWSDKVRSVANGKLVFYPSQYPKEWKNDGYAILNDWKSDIVLVTAPNQTGKSFIGTAFSILRIIPTDENWPIFVETPTIYHEWTGPKTWIVASYSWDNVATVWKRYQELLPRSELGPFAPMWGKYEGENGRARELSFRDHQGKAITLACGSRIKFLCYIQQQMHWEGFDGDGAHADEQIPIDKMTGLQRAFTTRGDYTPIIMTLTGHVLEDRPDTGAAGWIKKVLWDAVRDESIKEHADVVEQRIAHIASGES